MADRYAALMAILTDEWQDVYDLAPALGLDTRYGCAGIFYKLMNRAVKKGDAEARRVWADNASGALTQWRRRP